MLIPSPNVAENHQYYNALELQKAGAAVVIEEKNLTGEGLVKTVEELLNTPGKLGGNWTWRAAEGFDAEPLASRIQAECEVYCRAKEPVEKEAKTSI